MNIEVLKCLSCGLMGLKSDSMDFCLCCEHSPRKQGYARVCSANGCQKPILSRFNIQVGVESEEAGDPPAIIVKDSVNMIIHGIIMLEGPQCEGHMSDLFGEFCSRENNAHSLFDLIYKSNEELYVANRLKEFQEEWA